MVQFPPPVLYSSTEYAYIISQKKQTACEVRSATKGLCVTVELQAYYTICKARNTNTATTTKIPIAIARSTVIGFLPSCS